VREPNHLRRHVVDQHGAINTTGVHELEESSGRATELDDLLEVGALLLHQFQRVRLEHFHRLDVNVAVGDHIAASRSAAAFYQPAAGQGTKDVQSIPRWNCSSGSNVVLKLNANWVGPCCPRWARRLVASSRPGRCPAGTHHSAIYTPENLSNHSSLWRRSSACAVL